MAPDLVARLALIQEAHGWTDEEMATRAGIARPMWAAARSRKAKLGHRSLGAIVRSFPELREQVLSYLADEADTPEPEPKEAVA